tara:strand:- start:1249 stop:1659 length:411 start_codon:yes stop_codon:yes gene_type:complete
MAVTLERRVDYPMIDNANIAYYPRIYDLAHRFFEESWELMCGITYPEIIGKHNLGFPVVNIDTKFIHPLRYGDVVTAEISMKHIGGKSCTWQYDFFNQESTHLWTSTQVTVCVDMNDLAPVLIPDWLREGLEKHLI